jgi:hypothetical protein
MSLRKILIFLILFIVLFIGFFLFKDYIFCYYAAKGLLTNVKNGDFEQAFNYVDYYDIGDDVKSEISFEKAKNIWTSRMKNLQNEGVYLIDYKNLKIYKDDGYPKGRVTVQLSENGVIREYKCGIHFTHLTSIKWKVCDIEGPKHIFFETIGGYCNE